MLFIADFQLNWRIWDLTRWCFFAGWGHAGQRKAVARPRLRFIKAAIDLPGTPVPILSLIYRF
jgi:hypothetical protein